MLGVSLSVLLIGYLPGALIFRLPLARPELRARLSAEERCFWGVALSMAVSSVVGLGLAAGGMVVAAGALLRRRLRLALDLEAALRETLGRRGILEIALLALFSGVAEETFFRGALQPVLGWVAASLLFGAVHFVPRKAYLLWTPFAVVVGFLLGGLYEWSGNIWAPVTAHVTINALNLWAICGPGSGAISPSSPTRPSAWPSPPPTDSEAPEPPQ